MVKRLQYSTYVLTVEGECEKWYFEHLRNLINANEDKKKTCVYKPDIKTNKNPKSYAKSFASLRVPFFHIQDIEDYNDPLQRKKFEDLLRDIKEARRIVNYNLGYSNFTFDLWICLHKKDMPTSKAHRGDYVTDINEAYGTHFEYIDEYKNEHNFKTILSTITLNDVRNAIKRAKKIRDDNEKDISTALHQKKIEFSNFSFYSEYLDLYVQDVVEKILKYCLK